MAFYESIIDQANDARTRITEVSPNEAGYPGHSGKVFIDVREESEFESGHIEGAILIPRQFLESQIADVVKDKQTPIIVYCAIGHRSAIAADTLQDLGYTHVSSLEGGFQSYAQSTYERKVA